MMPGLGVLTATSSMLLYLALYTSPKQPPPRRSCLTMPCLFTSRSRKRTGGWYVPGQGSASSQHRSSRLSANILFFLVNCTFKDSPFASNNKKYISELFPTFVMIKKVHLGTFIILLTHGHYKLKNIYIGEKELVQTFSFSTLVCTSSFSPIYFIKNL